jgi:hypothetical protein
MPIYRKGGDESGLRTRALQQGIAESSATRNLTGEQRYKRDVESGVQGAKNIVNLNPTIKEVTENPTMLGGPVSGSALAKLGAKKREAKATKEKEMKRR